MEDKTNISNCQHHKEPFRFLCNQCNQLICDLCIGSIHCRHEIIHVGNLKSNLSQNIFTDLKNINDKYDRNVSNNINNDSSNKNNNFLISKVESLLESINSIKTAIAPIQENNNLITQHFRKLHDLLIVEETKLKKPTAGILNIVSKQINIKNKELESILSVLACYQQLANSSNTEENEINSDCSTSDLEDKVIQSSSYQSLIEIFPQLNLKTSIEVLSKEIEQIQQHNKLGLDFLLLEMFQRHRSKLQQSNLDDIKEIIDSTKKKGYKVIINPQSLQQLKEIMKESISVSTGKVLLVCGNSQGASIFDISKPDIKFIENIDLDKECQIKSIFKYDESIYFFDGKSYRKFSLANRKQEIGNITLNYEKIESFNLFQNNEDGNVYYCLEVVEKDICKLIIGEFSMSSMSIDTRDGKMIKPIVTIINFESDLKLVFTYRNKIYLATSRRILCYCLEQKKLNPELLRLDDAFRAICTDGHGIIYYLCYIYRKVNFQKINIITGEKNYLEFPDPLYVDFPMIYHSNRLFLIKEKNNSWYDIQLATWKEFNEYNHFYSQQGGAVIMEF